MSWACLWVYRAAPLQDGDVPSSEVRVLLQALFWGLRWEGQVRSGLVLGVSYLFFFFPTTLGCSRQDIFFGCETFFPPPKK